MKVEDFISKMVDNYLRIVVEVFDHNTHLIKDRFKIAPHATNYTNIPDSVWQSEIGMIIVHHDSVILSVSDESELS